METIRQPRSAVDIEIPANCIRAIFGKRLERIDGISLGFAHLLAVFILHVSKNDNIFKRSLIKQQCGDRHQRIEPASGLIHCLRNKLSREVFLEIFFIFKRIVILRKRHGTGIEPAVDHFRYPVHRLSALRAANRHLVDERTVQLDLLRAVIRKLMQLLLAADGLHMSALALPDIQRSTPVTVPGKSPVLYIFQPVAETSLTDALRNPVYRIIIAHQIIAHRSHLDEPGLACIINQRCITAPAVRVAMLKLRCGIQQSSRIQILDDLRGNAVLIFEILSCNTGVTGPFRLLRHHTILIDELQERKIIFSADLAVVLTKCRCDMYNTGTIGHRNIRITYNIVRFLFQLYRVKRLVLLEFKILTLISLKDIVGLCSEHSIRQRSCQIVYIVLILHFDLDIILIRIHAERNVRRKGPRCRRPRKNVRILPLHLEACDCGTLLDVLISLCHLMARKRGTAARAVRYDLIALVQKLLLPDLL